MYDLVVIGDGVGGIISSFAASTRGIKVCLVGKGYKESASYNSAGMLSPIHTFKKEFIDYYKFIYSSINMYEDFLYELNRLNIKFDYKKSGSLFVSASISEDIDTIYNYLKYLDCNIDYKSQLNNYLIRDKYILNKEDGYINPRYLFDNLVSYLLQSNKFKYINSQVNKIFVKDNKILSCIINNSLEIFGRKFIISTGTESIDIYNENDSIIKLNSNIRKLNGELIISNNPGITSVLRTTSYIYNNAYLVPYRGGEMSIGSTMDEMISDRPYNHIGNCYSILESLSHLINGFFDLEILQIRSGLRSLRNDSIFPYIDIDKRYKNLFCIFGLYRNGISLIPYIYKSVLNYLNE